MKAIYGHTSEDTAYTVDDYPYGFRLRCKIRYWLEHNVTHGYRFVSQTTNPKKGNKWNTPKKSTYCSIAASMYLDENNHVHWTGVGAHSGLEAMREFQKNFPSATGITMVGALIHALEKRAVSK